MRDEQLREIFEITCELTAYPSPDRFMELQKQLGVAMDACYQALAIEPPDPDVHLLLAELYLDRGWRGPAADKLVLLGRLSRLTGDERHPDPAVRAGHGPSARRPEVRRPLRLTAPHAGARPTECRVTGPAGARCYTRGRCRFSSRSSIRST